MCSVKQYCLNYNLMKWNNSTKYLSVIYVTNQILSGRNILTFHDFKQNFIIKGDTKNLPPLSLQDGHSTATLNREAFLDL